MNNFSSKLCPHIQTVVDTFSEDYRKTKGKCMRCWDCHNGQGIIHQCMNCAYFGCIKYQHIMKHSRDYGHIISMDIKFGNVFCHLCDDYIYDIDRHSKAFNRLSDEIMGLRGLTNLGNTCYVNSLIQVLTHCPSLREYFQSKHQCEIEDQQKCLVCEMFITFQEFYSGNLEPYSLTRLVYLLCIHSKNFDVCHPQDVHELYIQIMHILHKQFQGKDPDETNSCICVIHQVFRGFYRSDIACQKKCKYVSTTYQPFLDINLNIGWSSNAGVQKVDQDAVPLSDCISRYTQPENLPIPCEKCGKATLMKKLSFKVLPAVACFHLNRLEDSSNKKNSRHVIFPECLDMSPFMSSNRSIVLNEPNNMEEDVFNMSENKFCLFAVVVHKGNRDGGHFISYIKHHNKWYQCNDHLITSASMQDVLASEGYLLFYQKQVLEEGNVSTLFEQNVPNKGPG